MFVYKFTKSNVIIYYIQYSIIVYSTTIQPLEFKFYNKYNFTFSIYKDNFPLNDYISVI